MDRYMTDRDLWEVSPEIRKNQTFAHLLGPKLRKVYNNQYEDFPYWFANPPEYVSESESGWEKGIRFFEDRGGNEAQNIPTST